MTVLLIIGIILLVLWIAGLTTGTRMNGLVHIALIIALILLIIWFLRVVVHAF